MGHFEIEGICKVDKGYEGDSVDYSAPGKYGDGDLCFGISKLVEKAIGVEVPNESDIWCFDSNDVGSEENKERIAFYRQHFERQFPPVYRVKFTVDAEEISLEEAEKFWKLHEWDSSKFEAK